MVLQSGHSLIWCFSCEVVWSRGLKHYSFMGSGLGSPPLGWFPWLNGVRRTGCCLQGQIRGSANIKGCFHPWCSQGTFPSMLRHWAEPSCSPRTGSAQHTQPLSQGGRASFHKELMKLCKRLAKTEKKNPQLLNTSDSCCCFYSLGLNQGYFAEWE